MVLQALVIAARKHIVDYGDIWHHPDSAAPLEPPARSSSSKTTGTYCNRSGLPDASSRSNVGWTVGLGRWLPHCGVVDTIDTKPCDSHYISDDVFNLVGQANDLTF